MSNQQEGLQSRSVIRGHINVLDIPVRDASVEETRAELDVLLDRQRMMGDFVCGREVLCELNVRGMCEISDVSGRLMQISGVVECAAAGCTGAQVSAGFDALRKDIEAYVAERFGGKPDIAGAIPLAE